MKNIFKIGMGMVLAAFAMTSCGSYEPRGYEEVPNLPKATDITATVGAHHIVDVTWKLPANTEGLNITDVQFILNANTANPVSLGPTATSYSVAGVTWEKPSVFTVKIVYDEKYISEGRSITYEMPVETLPGVTDLTWSQKGRKVILNWKNPAGITGVRVLRDGEVVKTLEGDVTSTKVGAQPMGQTFTYTVEALYDTYYPGVGASTSELTIPVIESKMAFLLLGNSISDLEDDDEIAAATWANAQEGLELYPASKLADLDSDEYSVLWIMVDRVGLPMGWENLPAEVSSPTAIALLNEYSADGGKFYLSNMATQLTVPLNIVPSDMAPTVFGNGNGGTGNDVWTINPQLGFDFGPDGNSPGAQDFYDRTEHDIYKGLEFSDPNNWGLIGLPLIGPGQREDHNCLWDCNIYGKGGFNNVIANFEDLTSSLVLATWGHVRDHCVAGLVVFYATPQHSLCVANGFAAYEWNQNSNPNIYQENVEKLTSNILDFLKNN